MLLISGKTFRLSVYSSDILRILATLDTYSVSKSHIIPLVFWPFLKFVNAFVQQDIH